MDQVIPSTTSNAGRTKKSTYKRRSQMVSTVRKSQAIIADACARRNSDQLKLSAPQRRLDPVLAQDPVGKLSSGWQLAAEW